MKEVPCMYRLKPICGLPVRVELPKCMYRLRQIQGSYDATDVRRDNIMAKSHEIEEQESAPKEVLQLVVKASPARIPHALLALIQSSCSGVEDASKVKPRCVEVNWHSHSTLCKPLPSLPSSNEQSCAPSIRITFIWKDAVKQVEFSIGNSPVWLKGEPLLMRVILSHLSSTPVKDNVVTDVALAALLDSCAAISDISSESSSSSIKQTFSEANKWFSCLDLIPSNSHSMSVGEMSLWGALKSVSSIGNDGCLPQETPAKLKDWFTSYSKFLGY
ncbi:uncharacterized protein LOC124169493 isoform X4 [Ischnura elegans]|uniref:uncharacterized protein LOC124169493 isoform X4 n=1 Tax=Ischnura elegans TaxID=197161 RepID=UPI001ED894B0|nr:uncharacterized protein LOC124169493 isoform X4 [Ischnura elegans]